jgi:hypothetical protein
MEIALLVESVAADAALRLTVGPAIVSHDLQTALAEPLDDASCARSVVGDAVKINERASSRAGCLTSPAPQVQLVAF